MKRITAPGWTCAGAVRVRPKRGERRIKTHQDGTTKAAEGGIQSITHKPLVSDQASDLVATDYSLNRDLEGKRLES